MGYSVLHEVSTVIIIVKSKGSDAKDISTIDNTQLADQDFCIEKKLIKRDSVV